MNRNKYLTTGELARLLHVTKNTLFHYDKMGLFSPEIVLENDYRYYSIHQIEVLDAIIVLRDLEMPLKEIRDFLEGRNPEKLLALFAKEEAQIEAQIRRLKDQRRWIKEKSEKVRNVLAVKLDKIYVRHQPETYYVMHTFEIPTDTVYAEKITELTEVYESRNHSICYEIGCIQKMEDIRRRVYDNYQNAALVMKHRPRGMQYFTLPEGEYLVAYLKGHWKDIGVAYERMMEYAVENEVELSEQFLEVYAVDSLMAEREEDYVTEISAQIENRKRT